MDKIGYILFASGPIAVGLWHLRIPLWSISVDSHER